MLYSRDELAEPLRQLGHVGGGFLVASHGVLALLDGLLALLDAVLDAVVRAVLDAVAAAVLDAVLDAVAAAVPDAVEDAVANCPTFTALLSKFFQASFESSLD